MPPVRGRTSSMIFSSLPRPMKIAFRMMTATRCTFSWYSRAAARHSSPSTCSAQKKFSHKWGFTR